MPYIITIPTWNFKEGEAGPYQTITQFDNQEDAIAFVVEQLGADKKGHLNLIVEIQKEENEWKYIELEDLINALSETGYWLRKSRKGDIYNALYYFKGEKCQGFIIDDGIEGYVVARVLAMSLDSQYAYHPSQCTLNLCCPNNKERLYWLLKTLEDFPKERVINRYPNKYQDEDEDKD